MRSKIVFVIGSGRSGTHLIGRIIGSHPHVEAFIEDDRTFALATKIATQQTKKSRLKKLIKRYKGIYSEVEKPIVLEKSHPNIWSMEELSSAFPDSLFVGIYRDAFSTVSSMIRHKGVSNWFNILPNDQLNPFLGITERNIGYYQSLSLEEKCALRWLSHKNRLDSLHRLYADKVHIINYNDLLTNQERKLKELALFMKVENTYHPEKFNHESTNKWKEHLTSEQQLRIEEIIKANT